MYDENNHTVSLKSIFVRIILVVLLIFVLMILFPTKGFVTNYVDQKIKETNKTSNNFNSNLIAVATAARGYFTSSRLPQNTNDQVTLTLGDMLDKKLIVSFTDSNGKACNNKKSYALVTKEKDEYTMKVNLSCTDKEDYIILHMGLNDTSFPSTSTARCEFVKNLDATWAYGSWSSWSTTTQTEDATHQVETKVDKIQTGTKTVAQNSVIENASHKYTINGNKIVYVCSTNYDNAGTYNSPVTCRKNTIKNVNKPVYKYITYYRIREKSQTATTTDTKWSSCNDNNLINQGYTKTGKTKN